MSENENLVPNGTENAEQTAEQTPVKTYTQDEVDALIGKRLARNEAKIRKEYDRKYGGLTDVLKAGTGKETVEEMTDTFTQFYEKKGIQIKKQPEYSAADLQILAKADADEIIRSGYEDVVDEVDRLVNIGVDNMTDREKAIFKVLAEHRKNAETSKELAEIGVTEDVYNSQEFKDFAGKFNPSTPIKDIYNIFAKTQPKKEVRTMGSMTNTEVADNGVKDFYTYEEAMKFSKADFDKNPLLYKRVQESMTKW